jgi:hypothetical protein
MYVNKLLSHLSLLTIKMDETAKSKGAYINKRRNMELQAFSNCTNPFLCSYLNSLSSRVRSLISMPESLTADIVLGNSSTTASANIENEFAALFIA